MNKAKYLTLLPLFALAACSGSSVPTMSIDEVKEHLLTFTAEKFEKVKINSYVSFGGLTETKTDKIANFYYDNISLDLSTVGGMDKTSYPSSPISTGVPMFIQESNYLVMTTNSAGEEEVDIANSFHYVMDSLLIYRGSIAKMIIEKTADGGIAFYSNNTSTYYAAKIDGENASGHARYNIRYEYNSKGYLVKERINQVETNEGDVGRSNVYVKADYEYFN